MLTINSNIAALSAQYVQQAGSRKAANSMLQLSTGRRINSAVDDVAGLAISTRLTSQIRGSAQAIRNANDAISMLQTAEGATDQITNILQRMRELAIQSSNNSNNQTDRDYLNNEFQQLKSEINRIAKNTQWNGKNLLDGTDANGSVGYSFQIGGHARQTVSALLPNLTTQVLNQANTGPTSESPVSIVTGSWNSQQISVFTDDGSGTFTEQQLQGDRISYNVAIADINSDKKLDIITSSNVFENNGSGSFSKSLSIPSTGDGNDVYATDVNADGNADILISNLGSSATFYLNQGNNSFSNGQSFGTSVLGAIFADVNSDGNQDILTANFDGTVSIFRGNGAGAFSYDRSVNVGGTPGYIRVADLNGDGVEDIVSANQGGNLLTYTLGNSDGSFQNFTSISGAHFGYGFEVGDVNNDGLPDIVTAESSSNSFSVYQNHGTFFTQTTYSLGLNGNFPHKIAIADLNNDKSQDVLVSNTFSQNVNIFQNDGSGQFILQKTIATDHQLIGVRIGVFGAEVSLPSPLNRGKLIGLATADIKSNSGAITALSNIDHALEITTAFRSDLGANINRIQFASDVLFKANINAQESLSRIQDTDYSSVTTELSKQQIIQQAATAMLAQANQEPQVVLQLLKSTSS